MDQVTNPHLPWLLEYGGTAGFAVVLVLVARQVIRRRTLTPTALMVLGGWSIWWQEWWLDWAYYLIWSPEFDVQLHDDWTGWTTPFKPWLLVMSGYGYYWAAVIPGIAWLTAKVRRARPNWSRWRSYLAAAVPMAYGINLLFEGTCTQMGWWSYTEATPPLIHFGEGKFSLVYPIAFMTLFPVVLGALLDRRDAAGRFAYEARLGITGRRGAVGFELRRAIAIVVLMNIVYFLAGVGPGIAMRYAFGPESSLVP